MAFSSGYQTPYNEKTVATRGLHFIVPQTWRVLVGREYTPRNSDVIGT